MYDISPTVVIALLGLTLTTLTLFGGVIGAFIRIEVKTNTNAQNIDDLYQKTELHHADRSIHHPADELDRRFDAVNQGIEKIDKGIEKLNDRFDKFLQSQ